MIVTLNSDNPNDALLIERLFAQAERTGCCGDRQMELPLVAEEPAVTRSAPEAVATVTAPLPPFLLPEPPAPVAPPAEPPSVDATGLPWDARIHSESKATVADGTWRKRRNVDPELVKQVEAELRGESPVAATPAVAAPSATEASASVPPPPPPPTTITITNTLDPERIVEAMAAPEPVATRSLTDLSAAIAQGKLKMADLTVKAQEHGCADAIALTNNPLALAAVIAFYDEQGLFQ